MLTTEATTLLAGGFAPQRDRLPTNRMGQEDFLLLMTTQLRNQDPFAPMENAEFLGQMAQFATVSGLETANTTLSSIQGGINDHRIATAATLLGQSVLVPGSIGRAGDDGILHGAVDLPGPVQGLRITYSDPATGDILHRQDLGPQPGGMTGFAWAPPEGSPAARGRIPLRIEISAQNGDAAEPLGPSVYARVMAVHTGRGLSGVLLDVEDYGQVDQIEVSSYR